MADDNGHGVGLPFEEQGYAASLFTRMPPAFKGGWVFFCMRWYTSECRIAEKTHFIQKIRTGGCGQSAAVQGARCGGLARACAENSGSCGVWQGNGGRFERFAKARRGVFKPETNRPWAKKQRKARRLWPCDFAKRRVYTSKAVEFIRVFVEFREHFAQEPRR
ncbi:hypothetical protein [Aquimixticola soesokkakensis]|uniref:hypothetical protein n=1 Tax=Aquimixticola soesokkakensis TaxID=1519096 RepID=UPI001177C0D6|nr:hypothetical protein [Aquimixticola soesokkakensis]